MKSIAAINNFKTLKEQFLSINYSRHEEVDWTILNKRFASLTADSNLSALDLYYNTNGVDVLDNMVGQYQPGTNGRWFRMAKNGAVLGVTGNLYQGSAEDTQFDAMAVLAAAISTSGLQTVTVTNGTTTVNINDFVGGNLGVNVTPDLCSDYVITGHTVGTSGASLTVTLDRPLRTAWNTSTKVNMKRNPWSGIILGIATTYTNICTGVMSFAATASTVSTTTSIGVPQYTWMQTHGITTVQADGSAILKNSSLSTGSGTAGAAQLHPFSGNVAPVGQSLMANGSAAKGIAAFLTID